MDITKLARKTVREFTPYQSARKIGGQGDIWLNANESPFENHYQMQNIALNRYSVCQPPQLLQAYSHYAQIDCASILTSRGADESIDLLIRAFCEPETDYILYCPPTYGMYSISAQIAGVRCKQVPLTQNWQLNLPAISQQIEHVKLIFICSPNNPTGNLIAKKDIEALLEMSKGQALVVVDEAYIDFCPQESMIDKLLRYPHLVILRTLSKAFALAGLRCGFTLANPRIIDMMRNIIAPYPVPVPVIDIACQALSEQNLIRMKAQVTTINTNRAWLQSQLSLLPNIKVFDSASNFLLLITPKADHLFEALWHQGIILRRSAIDNSIRISVGLAEQNEKTIALMRDHLQENNH